MNGRVIDGRLKRNNLTYDPSPPLLDLLRIQRPPSVLVIIRRILDYSLLWVRMIARRPKCVPSSGHRRSTTGPNIREMVG